MVPSLRRPRAGPSRKLQISALRLLTQFAGLSSSPIFRLASPDARAQANCELCDRDLPPDSADARICSYECTFCAACVEDVLHGVCPNCGGGFQPRPIRPARAHRDRAGLGKPPPGRPPAPHALHSRGDRGVRRQPARRPGRALATSSSSPRRARARLGDVRARSAPGRGRQSTALLGKFQDFFGRRSRRCPAASRPCPRVPLRRSMARRGSTDRIPLNPLGELDEPTKRIRQPHMRDRAAVDLQQPRRADEIREALRPRDRDVQPVA